MVMVVVVMMLMVLVMVVMVKVKVVVMVMVVVKRIRKCAHDSRRCGIRTSWGRLGDVLEAS